MDVMPDGLETMEEFVDELEAQIHYQDEIIDMLRQRLENRSLVHSLEEDGIPASCICSECVKEFRLFNKQNSN